MRLSIGRGVHTIARDEVKRIEEIAIRAIVHGDDLRARSGLPWSERCDGSGAGVGGEW